MRIRWVSINGYTDYEVSNTGNIYSSKSNIILKPDINHRGYHTVKLYYKNKRRGFFIHRLVAIHFKKNPNNFPEIHHIDYNKNNNAVRNLKWCTGKQNIKDAYVKGVKNNKCENNPFTIFNNASVRRMRKMHDKGTKVSKIADAFSAKYCTVWKIVKGFNYKDL